MERSLAQWLDWQGRIHPQTIELGLRRMQVLLRQLAVPRPRGPVIVVAGTNGKGSVCAHLEALLSVAGFKVGLYTSPHLITYNERIRIHRQSISDEALCEAFSKVEEARGDLPLTVFEYGTAAALLAFSQASCDAWVLEIGLGGRLDAVNAVDADASVVVSIGLDHTDWLGPDLDSIGREKAGVFRKGCPAVLGSATMPGSVRQVAADCGAVLWQPGLQYTIEDVDPVTARWAFVAGSIRRDDLPSSALPGAIQRQNAATALAALAALDSLPSQAVIAQALTEVSLPGRFQRVMHGGVEWVLDVSHNPAAALVLAANLRAMPVVGRTYAVIGLLADKDAAGVAAALSGLLDGYVAVGLAGQRARDGLTLSQALRASLGEADWVGDDPVEGLGFARQAAQPGDRVVVLGSFHMVGPALEWLRLYFAGQK